MTVKGRNFKTRAKLCAAMHQAANTEDIIIFEVICDYFVNDCGMGEQEIYEEFKNVTGMSRGRFDLLINETAIEL